MLTPHRQRTRSALAASLTLCFAVACSPKVGVVPDESIVHMVARDREVEFYFLTPDGTFLVQPMTLRAGWVCASPLVVAPFLPPGTQLRQPLLIVKPRELP